MSETDLTPKQKCEKAGGTYDPDTDKCTMPDDKQKALVDRMAAVFKEALNVEMKAFKEELKAQREKIVKENEEELEKALRQSLGVDKDLPVTRSQIAEVVRKALLEEQDSQKRTPAPEKEKAGTENKPDQFEQMMKEKGLVA